MLEALRRFGRQLIEHPHYKLLAVLLALSAWWYVQAGEVDTRRVRLRVDWHPPAGLVTSEPLPPTVLATLEGSRNALKRVAEGELRLDIDLADVANDVGDHSLELNTYEVRGLPGNVSCVEISPATLSFTLDQVDQRSVTVRPVVVGEPSNGWMVVQTRLEPSVVEVRGPRVALANLVNVDTLPIDVSGLRHDKRFETRLDLPRSVDLVGTDRVEARVDVEPMVESRVFSAVPVFVRDQVGWIAEPRSVRVRVEGPAASLRQIEERQVVAQVYLPDVPTRTAYEVAFAGAEGVRAEVTIVSDNVKVVEVVPSQIKVMRP